MDAVEARFEQGRVWMEKQWTEDMFEVQEMMMANLENQRASVSGVSIDEEILLMERYQQMLEASVKYVEVINEMNDVIMNMAL